MVQTLLLAVWVIVVALGTSYAAIAWRAGPKPVAAAVEKSQGNLETVKLRLISVPLIVNAKIEGYIMAQLAFSADAEMSKHMTVKPDMFVRDEAFQVLYSSELFDFRHLRKDDVQSISRMIKDNVNRRLGRDFLKDVFVEDLTFVSKDQVRQGRGTVFPGKSG